MDSKSPDAPTVSAALDQLWLKFRPQIEERAAVLTMAAAALAHGDVSPDLREQAQSAAHKLAGSLGTFGLIAAGELAREAEILYQAGPGADSAARLVEIAAELRAVILSRS